MTNSLNKEDIAAIRSSSINLRLLWYNDDLKKWMGISETERSSLKDYSSTFITGEIVDINVTADTVLEVIKETEAQLTK
jgi:hypothetical protein